MIGIDSNVLIALAAENHPSHRDAVRVFEDVLIQGEQVCLSSSVAAEFLHVITDSKRLSPSHSMEDSVAWLHSWEAIVAPVWLASSELSIRQWLDWMRKYKLGRKRILDTQYAAMLHANGVSRLMTSNPGDFRLFEVFDLVTF